jgi:hypothetical protein
LPDNHFKRGVNADNKKQVHGHIAHIHIALKPERYGQKGIDNKGYYAGPVG